jgi:hypothetical protein
MRSSKPLPVPDAALKGTSLSPFGAFIDRLIQTFEDCRPGLSDAAVAAGEAAVEAYFLEICERERPRLLERVREQSAHLVPEAADALYQELDRLIRTVVVPAYVRLAARVTPPERNGFYLAREPFHGLERLGWGVAGLALGALALWAPFIPLWSKEWVLPFMVVGLLFPNLRGILALRRYERDLNRLVSRADREVARIDVAYLMSPERGVGARVQAVAEDRPLPDPDRRRIH